MLLYYIRHADPIYDPDSITEHGKVQAQALAERLGEAKIDKVFASSSNRAMMTAEPTCKKLNLDCKALDWAREDLASREFMVKENGKNNWCFFTNSMLAEFNTTDVMALGAEWYTHEKFKDCFFKQGIERIGRETDKFFEAFGYRHDRENRNYIVENPSDEKIAFFSHGGFGMAFMSSLLDIPYNLFCLHFEHISTSCMTVISFTDCNGISVPKIIEYSGYSHLYKEGLKPYHYLREFK